MTTAVREASPDEVAAVMNVLDAGFLDVEAETVTTLVESDGEGTVLVAVEADRVLGALVLRDSEVEALAVRPGRRGQGIGSRLIERAATRVEGQLVAEFHRDVREFYEKLGFQIERIGEDRFRGTLD